MAGCRRTDQEDIAHIYKRIRFRGRRIVTLSEGEVNELHIGFKGTMGALLPQGSGRQNSAWPARPVEAGRSGGGNSYGYEVVKKIGDNGEPVHGERRISPRQAATVKRILATRPGASPSQAIAKEFNSEGVPGPSGRGWAPSMIHGNWQHGTGISNNEAPTVSIN
jgi:site-specific DNA recombinase